jgi:serine/threonine-protein kinase
MSPDISKIPDNSPPGSLKDDRLAALAHRIGAKGAGFRLSSLALFVFLFMGTALASVLALHWAVSGFLHSRKNVTVPDLVGKNLEQALDLLSPQGLGLTKEAVQFDENSPPGAILRQSPPAGLQVREGKIVRVTLSSGGQVLFIPDLTAVTLTEAQNRLRAAGLALGAVTQVYSIEKPAGMVIEQNPASNGVAHRNAMVDLRVSKGPPPEGTVLMPDFINRPFTLARQWAEDQRISPDVKEELTAAFLPGLVIRQTPAPDSTVSEKTAIHFVVARSSSAQSQDVVMVRYQVPEGSDRVTVRVVLRDDGGEREVYSSSQGGGSVVEVPVSPQGASRARIFVNGVLVEERPLQ